jgi:hypothetical protein
LPGFTEWGLYGFDFARRPRKKLKILINEDAVARRQKLKIKANRCSRVQNTGHRHTNGEPPIRPLADEAPRT